MRVGYCVVRLIKHNEYVPYIIIKRDNNVWGGSYVGRIKKTRSFMTEEQADAVAIKTIAHRIEYVPWSYVGRVGTWQVDLDSVPIIQEAEAFYPKYNGKREFGQKPLYKLKKLKVC
jgi:hypothetical protein